MSIIVRAIDVGFGNTKYVTSSTNGKVECAHFPSLAFYCHNDQATESMGGKRRTVQVPVDGLFYEVGPDVELAADRFRSWQLHDGYTETAEYRAFTAAALHFMKIDTVDLLVVGLPVAQFLAKRSDLEKPDPSTSAGSARSWSRRRSSFPSLRAPSSGTRCTTGRWTRCSTRPW